MTLRDIIYNFETRDDLKNKKFAVYFAIYDKSGNMIALDEERSLYGDLGDIKEYVKGYLIGDMCAAHVPRCEETPEWAKDADYIFRNDAYIKNDVLNHCSDEPEAIRWYFDLNEDWDSDLMNGWKEAPEDYMPSVWD